MRDFPHIPGVDFAGTVASSDNAEFKTGDKVILNGWGVGERHWGGLSERAREPGQLKPQGALAAIGNDFEASVIPFLLRGIKLLGIDSVYQTKPRREAAWQWLARDLDLGVLESTLQEISLADVPKQAAPVLEGKVRGRLVVNVRG